MVFRSMTASLYQQTKMHLSNGDLSNLEINPEGPIVASVVTSRHCGQPRFRASRLCDDHASEAELAQREATSDARRKEKVLPRRPESCLLQVTEDLSPRKCYATYARQPGDEDAEDRVNSTACSGPVALDSPVEGMGQSWVLYARFNIAKMLFWQSP
jgi:hypothetical protein